MCNNNPCLAQYIEQGIKQWQEFQDNFFKPQLLRQEEQESQFEVKLDLFVKFSLA